MNHFLRLLTIATLLTSSSCKKEKPLTMPPLTFKGAETLGCYINDELFVAQKRDGFSFGYNFPATSAILFSNDTAMLIIEGHNWNTSENLHLEIHLLSIDTGTFILNSPVAYFDCSPQINHKKNGAFVVKKIKSEAYNEAFVTNEFYNGRCRILKIDTTAKIVSGTFEFMASNDSANVNVSEGRFDLKL